ncbi:response regulator [Olivibacter sitiensis]|uniref:response regulator n=1 Tax=Olivibacter sitiensis TaxID=376470 RepID=UPI000401EBDF|nr:response regulator [Olivibacter sitiensis]
MTKSKFNLIPLNYKLALIAIVPVIVLIFFFYKVEKEQDLKINAAESYDQKLRFSNAINTLKYEVLMERRYSLGKLFDKNGTNKLIEQRVVTDRAIQDLDEFISLEEVDTAYREYIFLDSLPYWREEIDNDHLSFGDIFSNYQKINDRLDFFSNASYLLSDKRLDDMMRLSHLLSYAAGYITTLRLNVYFHLISPTESPISMTDYNMNYDLLQSYVKEMSDITKHNTFQKYDAKMLSDRNVAGTLAQLKDIYQKQEVGAEYNAERWWNSSAAAVDALKGVQDDLVDEVSKGIEQLKSNELRSVYNNRLLLIACLIAVVVMLFYILRNIADHLFKLQTVASKIALGHTDVEFPNFAKDYIGKLAIAMQKIDERNKEMAHAASALGENNYGVPIIAKGEHDVLGTAMQQMKQSLYEHYLNDQKAIWLYNGKENINKVLIVSRTLEEFSTNVLEAIAGYLDASVGAFYVLDGEEITVMANLGMKTPQRNLMDFDRGDSLIGKAYISKKTSLYENHSVVQEEGVSIEAGTSYVQARWIMVIPIVHERKVLAIIELASVMPAQKYAKEFVEQIHSNIASALIEIKIQMRLKELLEETQAQTEELQAQHAELESLNVELEAQTNKLQASEEELRVQQAELMENNRQLEFHSRSLEEKNQIIIERNMDIRQKAEALELSTRYKSEFLANMSHELRTPLNSILLLSRLLSENHEGTLGAEQVEYANVIMNSGNSLLSLIDEILDLSKIESGKMTVEREHVELEVLLSDMKALFMPIAAEKGIELIFSVDENTPQTIHTDNLRLQQILRNLISNAIKFTARGNVTVTVEPHPDEKGNINFRVLDTGIGIPLEKQQLVFDAFQQADGSTRRKYGGTGLGLSISRELAKLLGGHLYVNSEVTDGAEFVLTMPVQNDGDSEQQPSIGELLNEDNVQALPEQPPLAFKDEGKAKKAAEKSKVRTVKNIPAELDDDRNEIGANDKVILIIEDDTNFAKVLMDYSRKNGYKVLSTVRGDIGVELTRQYLPLAVLLDIELPVKNGWQVMEEIKSDPHTRHIPVHIMSSHEAKRESISQGAIDFIRKPMALDQIADVFRKIEEALKAGPRKVLILEENLKHAQALSNYLQNYGVKAEIGETVQSSIDSLKSHEIDCVILDMGIPDASAYKTLETIKADAQMENLPVIIFTGKNISQSEEKKIKQYADSIVIKTAHSYERILDEVGLFLHLIENNRENINLEGRNRLLLDNALKGKTVLIADDDIRNVFSLTKVLEGYKMIVLVANDGKEAIEILNANGKDIDVVLMDMMMPEMDGYETISLIRKDARFTKLPILSVTAKAMTGDRERCIAVGASDYISKPVDTDQLVSLLRVWLYN